MYPTHSEFSDFGDRKPTSSTEETKNTSSKNSYQLQSTSNSMAPTFSNENQFNYQLFDAPFYLEDCSQRSVTGSEVSPLYQFEHFQTNASNSGNESSMLDNRPLTAPNSSPKFPLLKNLNSTSARQQQQSKSLANSIKSDMNDFLYPSNQKPHEESQTSFNEVPKVSSFATSTIKVYIVSFKRLSADFILHSRVTTPIAVGDLVVVSAERGCEDLGCVTRILSLTDFMSERLLPEVSVEGKPFNINKHTSKIVRLATVHERRKLGMKATDEMDVKQYCQHVATNSFRLPITITDVDFQFDRRKVTVYYSAVPPHQRVDFRDLVTHLSDVYTTRVWMVLE